MQDSSKRRAIFQAISMSEIYISTILLVLSISTYNVYLFLVLVTLFAKHIPEQILKRLSQHFNLSIGKRPIDAFDCSALNSGGQDNSSGVVSGHVCNISSLTFFLIFSCTANGRQMTSSEITLAIIMFIFIMLMAYARVELHCHTKEQVVAGFVLGFIWGYVMFLIVSAISSASPRVRADQLRISSFLNN